MDKDKIKITNPKQFEKLVEEMERNPELARGFRRGTVPNNFKEMWENISTMLNALGPPKRYGDGWQKVWRDLKCKVKRKLVANKAECTATGGGIYKQLTLSPLEETVANLLQFQKQINPEGTAIGLERQEENVERELQDRDEEIVDHLDLLNVEEPVGAVSEHTLSSLRDENRTPSRRRQNCPTPKNDQTSQNHYDLLQKHSEEQARLLADLTNSMSSVKRSLRDVSKFQKEVLDIQKKKLKLAEEKNERKKKKLKLAEEKNEREKEMYESEMKIKKIKIAIKEKELQVLNDKKQN